MAYRELDMARASSNEGVQKGGVCNGVASHEFFFC
jgi:hypothetical protein